MTTTTPVTWDSINDLLTTTYGATPQYQHRNTRLWTVSHPTSSHIKFSVEITLNPRWCSIDIDRWNTTTPRPPTAAAWFRNNINHFIDTARKQRPSRGSTYPGTTTTATRADPLDRNDLHTILRLWVEAELNW